jgi:ribonuclease HII
MPKEDSSKEGDVLRGGLDEVGRGCLAGPLTVAVVAFTADHPKIPGVRDSKKLSKAKREELAPIIYKEAAFVGIGWASAQHIDEHGINAAWQSAAMEALEGCPEMNLIVDGVDLVEEYQGVQEAVVKADDIYWQVSAASVVAKVMRDMEMEYMASYYPAYGWNSNVGYGTKGHRKQILLAGPSPFHRRSFLKKLLRQAGVS